MLNLIFMFGVWYWRTGPQCNIKIGFAHAPGTQLYSPAMHKSSVYIQLQFRRAPSSLRPAVKGEVGLCKQIVPPQAGKLWGLDLQDVVQVLLFD